jgi:hypothetical protein
MNTVDDYGRRWLYAVCFIISANNIIQLFTGTMLFDPLPRTDKEWMLRFGWLSGMYVRLYRT